ncbi:MAG: hypothetical protein H6747_10885 [Deltaproteobacteria bacterium]|nr:hypothetical protein [Deltaproteobacteria bacterium]
MHSSALRALGPTLFAFACSLAACSADDAGSKADAAPFGGADVQADSFGGGGVDAGGSDTGASTADDTADRGATDSGTTDAAPDVAVAADAAADAATDAATAADAGAPTCTPGYWVVELGGTGEDIGRAGLPMADGGVLAVGSTDGGGVASVGKGGRDVWMVRVDGQGALVWEQVVGNDLNQEALAIAAHAGGGATVAGTWREHGDTAPRGWVQQIDDKGAALATHTFAQADFTEVHGVSEGAVQGQTGVRLLVAGYVEKPSGDFQLALARLDPTTLAPQWTVAHGDTGFDVAWSVRSLADGSIAAIGDTAPGGSGPHVQLLTFDAAGKQLWQRTYFGDGEDSGWAFATYPDATGGNAGFTVVGSRKAPGASVSAAWLMHADGKGIKTWEQTISAPGGATAYDIDRVPGGGAVVVGKLAQSAGQAKAALWRVDDGGAAQWTLAEGATGGQAHAALAWSDAVGLVGQSGNAALSQLLLVRANMAGKTSCQP